MNAVIKVGGKQHYVQENSEIYVEKLDAEVGDTVKFDQVLMLDSKIGSPYLTNVTVEGEVIKNGKQKKIRVFKYKSKDRSNRKTQGHRQPYTKVRITKENDLVLGVKLLGHAMYADRGKDIVCSAVSSIVTTTINGILSLNEEGLSYEVAKDGLTISNISSDLTIQKLINNMISLLKELEKSYPTNVEVK